MSIITSNSTTEECTEPACVHASHGVDRMDPEDRTFHETAQIAGRGFRVWASRGDNERQWYVEVEADAALTAADALALADAIRLQAGVALDLSKEMGA